MNETLKQEIGFILKDFLKVVKVVSMYPADNPLPQSMRRSFAEKLVSLVDEYGVFAVRVAKGELRYEDEAVYEDRSKEEALAALFFETGITLFEFRDGLDVDDVYRLLDAVRTYLNTPGRTQDLVGLIWEAGVNGFRMETLEDVALSDYDADFDVSAYLARGDVEPTGDGQFGLDDGDRYASLFCSTNDSGPVLEEGTLSDSGDIPTGPASQSRGPAQGGSGTGQGRTMSGMLGDSSMASFFDTGADEDTPAESDDQIGVPIELARALGLGQPTGESRPHADTTIELNKEFSMSEEEEEVIQRLLEEDAAFEPYESTLDLAKELLAVEGELTGFSESVTICEKTVNEFVAAGRLIEAGSLLKHMRSLQDRMEDQKPAWVERLKEATVTAGSRDRLAVLAESLNLHPDIGVTEIRRYLDNFGWEALSSITDLMGEFEHQLHREALADYLTARGQDNIDVVAKGVFAKRPQVVRNSISILARIGDERALRYLSRVVRHEEPQVRMDLAAALRDCPSAEALNLLKELVADSDRAIRTQAVEAITTRRGADVFETIGNVIDGSAFSNLDRSDQQTLLNAYSRLGGEQAVPFLTQCIVRFNLFGDGRLTFLRTAAFEALSYNTSERGERMLVKLASSWRPGIRRQAAYAVQRRRENIYGQES